MKEQELNTIINKSINRYQNGWNTKIPDPAYGQGVQLPFDHFGVFNGKPLYMESKLIKGIYSFNFNRIEEHQFNNLMWLKSHIKDALCLVPIGFYVPRKTTYVLWFDILTIESLTKQGKTSILKKELERYIEQGMFLEIKSEKIQEMRVKYVQDIERLEEVII
jgi:penicillin-binding protein-related factor A (putative recombinase)